MSDPQMELRDVFLRTAMDAVDLGNAKNTVEAAVAAMGAAAVLIAMLPRQSRDTVIAQICEALPKSVRQRSREIESGLFDRQMDRRQ
ncbi:hypothetical protein [Bosea lathyri]|uniref:Uncharacterized protein n=1 Tax=Bosea lathyri TaxID=1036778 RepID=A0A1H6BEW6_9HYPH|nr:hypothetical protein [Bosea lathyri]SEG58837.1 hypothetical protein SAMN04488115_107156 [Bosea lathyri]